MTQPKRPITHGLVAVAAAALMMVGSPPRSAGAQEYIGNQRCQTCHRASHLSFAQTAKGRLFLRAPRTELERRGCESCHGPGSQHAAVEGREPVPGFVTFARNDRTPVERRNALCLQCHEGGARMVWQASAHDAGSVACTDCHSVMNAEVGRGQLRTSSLTETCGTCHRTQARAMSASRSRMPVHEERMNCASCHNPHGGGNDRLMAASSVNEVCYSCHAEKRGPFLWEHAPVAENCANCHDPHGGRNEMMLNRPKPRLCQQCHVEQRHPTQAQAITGTRFLMGRQCVNCHQAIHGSNHPGGVRFVR